MFNKVYINIYNISYIIKNIFSLPLSFFIHIAVVESKLEEAIKLLSGEKATERTVLE